MKRFGVARTVLAGAIGIVVLLHFVASPDPGRRSFEILPDMAHAIPWESQGSNRLFADRRNQREPAPGAAAIGFPAFRYAATPEDALRAGQELVNPLRAGDAGALARGGFVYDTFCRMCHASDGGGQGPMTKLGVPPPPSLLAERALAMADGQIYHILSLGQGNMASYASQVDRIDRWRVILHVRALQAAAQRGKTR